jgi:hypothetical protein
VLRVFTVSHSPLLAGSIPKPRTRLSTAPMPLRASSCLFACYPAYFQCGEIVLLAGVGGTWRGTCHAVIFVQISNLKQTLTADCNNKKCHIYYKAPYVFIIHPGWGVLGTNKQADLSSCCRRAPAHVVMFRTQQSDVMQVRPKFAHQPRIL